MKPIHTMSERKRRIAGLKSTEDEPLPSSQEPEAAPSSQEPEAAPSSLLYGDNNDDDEPSSFAAFFAEKKQPSEKEINSELERMKSDNKR